MAGGVWPGEFMRLVGVAVGGRVVDGGCGAAVDPVASPSPAAEHHSVPSNHWQPQVMGRDDSMVARVVLQQVMRHVQIHMKFVLAWALSDLPTSICSF